MVEAGTSRPARDPSAPPVLRVCAILLGLSAAAFLPVGLNEARRDPLESLLWLALISAANLVTIPMIPQLGIDATLSAPVSAAAAVVLSPPLALLVNGLSLTRSRELRDRSLWPWRGLYNHAQLGLSAAAASLAAAPFLGDTALKDAPLEKLISGTVVAVITYNIVNTAAVMTWLRLQGNFGLAQAAKESAAPFPRFAVDYGLVALLALFIVIAYSEIGAMSVVLVAMPLWLGFSALQSARKAEDRAEELAARVLELETLNALGSDLLTARRVNQVADMGRAALRVALNTPVEVSLFGEVAKHLQVVKIRGAEPAVIGVPIDLTERQRAVAEAVAGLLGMALQRLDLEQELGEVQQARAALSGEILEEGTRERSRIALEIHDDVLPYLAAAEIQADNVRSSIARFDLDRADRLAGATRDAVHGGVARLREVLEAMRRQIVVPGGLTPGLREALENLKVHYGVEGRLEAPDPLPPLPLAVEITLLETVRGCLTNVARHANASRVDVRLEVDDGAVSATVRDDGRGFHTDAVPSSRHGLALMTQRVELARGRFEVDSAPGHGTRVHVEVPL